MTQPWRMVSVIVCTLGCGRVAFDAEVPDGAASDGLMPCATGSGHDEDGDGVDDACDVCPHISDATQDNRDGDGVGDACDPSAVTTEQIAFFDPFVGRRSEWTIGGTVAPAYDGERLIVSTQGLTFLFIPWNPGREIYVLGGRVGAAQAAPKRQIALEFRGATSAQIYYCELHNGTGGTTEFNLSVTSTIDGTNYVTHDMLRVPEPLTDHALMLTMVRSPPTLGCTLPWRGTTHVVEGAYPPTIAVSKLALLSQGVQAELEYLIVIRSQ